MIQIFLILLIEQSFCSSVSYVYDLLRKPIMHEQINNSIRSIDYEAVLAQPSKLIITNWLEKFTKSKELRLIIFTNSFAFGENPYEFPLNEIYFFLQYYCHFWSFLRGKNRLIPFKTFIRELCIRTKRNYNRIIEEIDRLPNYSNHIMAAFQARIMRPAPLLPLKRKFYTEWFLKNNIFLPNLQQIIIIDLIHKKVVCSRFLKTLKETYSLGYCEAIKDAEENLINCRIAAENVPHVVQENMYLFYPIVVNWLRFWLLSMRFEMDALQFEREMTEKEGSLLDKMMAVLKHIITKLKRCQKLCHFDIRKLEYELEYSCVFADYLISIADFAIHFGLLTDEQSRIFANELRAHSIVAELIVRMVSSQGFNPQDKLN